MRHFTEQIQNAASKRAGGARGVRRGGRGADWTRRARRAGRTRIGRSGGGDDGVGMEDAEDNDAEEDEGPTEVPLRV